LQVARRFARAHTQTSEPGDETSLEAAGEEAYTTLPSLRVIRIARIDVIAIKLARARTIYCRSAGVQSDAQFPSYRVLCEVAVVFPIEQESIEWI
jgi:hypothetical protein